MTTAAAATTTPHTERLRRALARIERLEAELTTLRRGEAEPLAITGIGCRLPGGVEAPEGFWRLVLSGTDATGEVPARRWDATALHDPEAAGVGGEVRPGRIRARRGGFLGPVDGFDAAFWGISPREAAGMDPQQRLLLECAWEALEDAGLDPLRLRGARVGVFVGICGTDYAQMIAAGPEGLAGFDAYYASGTQHSAAAGRLSYLLGLRGPSLAVDTACSSSLVAVHLAVRSLRAGECDLALAGGVNLILTPTHSAGFSRAGGMLAADGRCKAFAAEADGYGRAEGCGVVVLRRQSAALAAGDRVWAVVRGGAVNQDGASSGLTVPNGPAQAEVIRTALAEAGAAPDAVAYVEAHGTGTALGDPIEAGALASVFAAGRPADRPLLLGSAKANMGHAEGAAGIVGLIKAALVLRHGLVPPHPGAERPTPHVDWASGRLALPLAATPLPPDALVGVSAFGFAGTNAHVVLGPAPADVGRDAAAAVAGAAREARAASNAAPGSDGAAGSDASCRVCVLVLSARSRPAVEALARRMAAQLASIAAGSSAAEEWAAACWTAATGRAALPVRIAVAAEGPGEASAALRRCDLPLVERRAAAASQPLRLLMLFTGQGAGLRPGTGAGLLAAEPAFARAWAEACAAFGPHLPSGGPGLHAAVHGPEAERLLARGAYAQPAQAALATALLALWAARGLRPDFVLGHSLGEYGAAFAAGVLDLGGLARLVAARGRLTDALAPGAMAATTAVAETVAATIAALPARLAATAAVAADHGAAGCTVAGDAEAVAALTQALARQGYAVQKLATDRAFHSPMVEPALDALARAAAEVPHAPPRIPLLSGVTGGAIPSGTVVDWPAHWARHMRGTVRFAAALHAAAKDGKAAGAAPPFALELGARPVLAPLARRTLPGLAAAASLDPPCPDPRALAEATAALWRHGACLDWAATLPPPHRLTALPTYPWDRRRHWSEHARQPHAAPPLPTPSPILDRAAKVGAFYDDLAEAYAALIARGLADPEFDLHLTYAPFPEPVPGFSWLETIRDPEARPDHTRLMLEAQRRLRALLFRRVELGSCRRVFDLGCGYGGDLMALAQRFPAMECVGHTASARQAEVARRLAEARGAGARVAVHHRDSTRHVPEGRFDLVLGFEAVHHMADPAALFGLLGGAIAPGGQLLLADLVAEGGAIADGKTLSALPAAADWAGWLAGAGLRLEEAICVSDEVANFLHDPDLEHHLERIGPGLPAERREAVREAFRGFVRLGALLRDGNARYILFSARRTGEDPAVLHAAALGALAQPTPFDAVAPERWLYEPVWEPAPAPFFTSLPSPASVAVEPLADPAFPAAALGAARARLDALACAYAAAAAQIAPAPGRERLARRVAALAAAHDPEALDPAALHHSDATEEFRLLRRCGEALPAILRGERDPLDLLFTDGAAARLYADAPTARRMNGLLRELVAAAMAARAGDAPPPLRVLEVGAGTGGTTAALLPVLPPSTDYLFTDVSPALLAEAAARFPGIRTAVLDVERSGAPGPGATRFDLIVAANVLHACRDVPAALGHLAGLLAPGGWLALLEGTAPAPWVDLTFGLTPGWWRFGDALRQEHPLLDAEAWRSALTAAGLEDVAALRPPEPLLFDQVVIAARRPPLPRRIAVLGGATLGEGLRARFGAAEAETADAVLDLRALDRPPTPDGVQAAAAEALALLQASAGTRRQPVWLVTRGAVAAAPGDTVPHLAGAPLWGLGLVAGIEQPEAPCRLLDLDPADSDPATTLLAALAAVDREDRIAWRGGARLAQRVRRRRAWPRPAAAVAPRLDADVVWLITGGRGGVGLAVAAWLAERGARDLVLAARGEPGPEALELAARLRARGVEVAMPRADVSRRGEVDALLAAIAARGRRLGGVVHAAGVLDDGALRHLGPERLARVLAPKAVGALHLHAATRHDLAAPDHFILFSSVAGAIGNAGQANHAAACAVLGALAHHRRAAGLPALAVDWGAWQRVGAAATRRTSLTGVSGFAPAEGLAVLERLMAEGAPQALVLPVDWPAFRAGRGGTLPRLFDTVAPPATAAAPAALPPAADDSPPAIVAALAAEVLGLPALPDTSAPLGGYGLDSLMAITLRNRLRERLGVDLPLARIVGGASAADLAAAVVAALDPGAVLPDVAAMSDAEVEAALRRLAQQEGVE